ncbi:MAG: flagellar hook-basal body complex protein FliE [Bacteroidetes bacterium]|nr:flagellar hook-basal body complex protein FliE [Bacteroidota bacterium]
MKISGINSFPQIAKINDINKSSEGNFGNVLNDFVKQVNADQNNSKQITNDFIEGKDVEIHEVMIAGEKAATSLDLLIEIRNKTIDMYKELSRM